MSACLCVGKKNVPLRSKSAHGEVRSGTAPALSWSSADPEEHTATTTETSDNVTFAHTGRNKCLNATLMLCSKRGIQIGSLCAYCISVSSPALSPPVMRGILTLFLPVAHEKALTLTQFHTE